jgi:hypothetical protein
MPQAAALTGMIRQPPLPTDYPGVRGCQRWLQPARFVVAETARTDVVPLQSLSACCAKCASPTFAAAQNGKRPPDLGVGRISLPRAPRAVSRCVVGSPIKGSVQA